MNLLRIFLAFVIAMHGLAHFSGVAAAWSRADAGFQNNPWLFSRAVTLKSPLGRFFGLVWLLAALVLAGAGLALVFAPAAWPGLPVAGALLSLLAILPWWRSVPPGAKAGALLDLLILAALLPPWGEQVLGWLLR